MRVSPGIAAAMKSFRERSATACLVKHASWARSHHFRQTGARTQAHDCQLQVVPQQALLGCRLGQRPTGSPFRTLSCFEACQTEALEDQQRNVIWQAREVCAGCRHLGPARLAAPHRHRVIWPTIALATLSASRPRGRSRRPTLGRSGWSLLSYTARRAGAADSRCVRCALSLRCLDTPLFRHHNVRRLQKPSSQGPKAVVIGEIIQLHLTHRTHAKKKDYYSDCEQALLRCNGAFCKRHY